MDKEFRAKPSGAKGDRWKRGHHQRWQRPEQSFFFSVVVKAYLQQKIDRHARLATRDCSDDEFLDMTDPNPFAWSCEACPHGSACDVSLRLACSTKGGQDHAPVACLCPTLIEAASCMCAEEEVHPILGDNGTLQVASHASTGRHMQAAKHLVHTVILDWLTPEEVLER